MPSAPPIIDLTGGGEADGFSIPPNPFASRPRSGDGSIVGIIFHHTGPGSLPGVMTSAQSRYLPDGSKNPGYGTGAQYYIDTDGTIYQYGPDSYRAYNIEAPGTKNRDDAKAATAMLANSNVIGIEIRAADSQHFTSAQKSSAVALGTYLAGKYSIAPSMIVGHGDLQSNRQAGEGVNVADLTRQALAAGVAISGYPGDLSAGGTSLGSLYAIPSPLVAPSSPSIDQLRAQAAARKAALDASATSGVVLDNPPSTTPQAPRMTPKQDYGDVVDGDMYGMLTPGSIVASGWSGGTAGISGDVALAGFGSTAISSSGVAPTTPPAVVAPAGPVEATKTDRQRTDLSNSPATLDQLVRQVYRGTGLPPQTYPGDVSQGSQPEPEFPGPPQRWMIEPTPIAANANIGFVAPVLTPSIAFAPPDSLAQTLSGTPYASMGLAFDHFTVPAAVAQTSTHTVPPLTSTFQKQPAAPAPVAATVKPQAVYPGDRSTGGDKAPPAAASTVQPVKSTPAPAKPSVYPGDLSLGGGTAASKAAAAPKTIATVPSAKPTTQAVTIINPAYVAWEKGQPKPGDLPAAKPAPIYPGDLSMGGVPKPIYPGDISLGGEHAPVAPAPVAVAATPAPPKYITKQVPTSAPRSSTPLSAGGYRVQSGDTLSAIAARSGVSVAALVAANGLANPDQIQAGGNLVIPGKAANSNAIPLSPSSTKNQASAKAAQNAGNGGGSNSGAVTFQGSSTKATYTAGQTYSNKAGTYIANSNGTFTKVG